MTLDLRQKVDMHLVTVNQITRPTPSRRVLCIRRRPDRGWANLDMGKVRTVTPLVRPIDTRCARPAEKRADPELLTPEHRAWRKVVCDRAGWRCEWVEHGRRCERSRASGDRMIADHIRERKDGRDALDPANGQCLCTRHNTLKGVRARAARMEVRL